MYHAFRNWAHYHGIMAWAWLCWWWAWLGEFARYSVGCFILIAVDWWHDRQARYFIEGLPAGLLAAMLLAVGILLRVDINGQPIASYRQQASQALQAGDFSTAHVAFQRLTRMEPDSAEFRFGLAVASEALGELERAAALIEKLAPLDRQGYSPAHLYQARRWLRGTVPAPVRTHFAEIHLYRAVQAQPDNLEAHALLGQLLFDKGLLHAAEGHLTRAAGQKPELGLALARVYAARGAGEAAVLEANRAEAFFRQQAAARLDNHPARLLQAETLVFLGRHAAAVGVLKEGLRHSGLTVYQSALVAVYIAWSDALDREGTVSVGMRLALLQEGLQHDLGNPALLMRLLPLIRLSSSGGEEGGPQATAARASLGCAAELFSGAPEAAAACQAVLHTGRAARHIEAAALQAALRALLARGSSPALIHLLLGTDAWARGKPDEARVHLEQAYQLDPQTALVVNNLAALLADAGPADWPRALALMTSLIERWPNQSNYRYNRGQLFARLGRWQEALLDYEKALAGLAGSPAVHQALAQAYQELHMPEIAAEHRRLAGAPR
ncbi:hypothetical protein AYO44_06465 [Planctomycetaceae bacterium SCGC AG-212-F19]|nr:hypothetical protein AYO44_06465 [Planctomycetaceae bacterium SCGC AG-212-F19]